MTSPNKYIDLDIICNGCGELMRRMGEWPVQFPRSEPGPLGAGGPKNMQQTSRFNCMTCRIPIEGYPKGVPVGIAIVEGVD